jgi:prophage regulatory protein
MHETSQSPLSILRRKRVENETGLSRSTIYARIKEGLWPKPVCIGPRSVGWLASEVQAMNAARVAGRTNDQIRQLVAALERARATVDDRG